MINVTLLFSLRSLYKSPLEPGYSKSCVFEMFSVHTKKKSGDILKRAIKKTVKRNRVYPSYFLLEKIEIKTLSGNVR